MNAGAQWPARTRAARSSSTLVEAKVANTTALPVAQWPKHPRQISSRPWWRALCGYTRVLQPRQCSGLWHWCDHGGLDKAKTMIIRRRRKPLKEYEWTEGLLTTYSRSAFSPVNFPATMLRTTVPMPSQRDSQSVRIFHTAKRIEATVSLANNRQPPKRNSRTLTRM